MIIMNFFRYMLTDEGKKVALDCIKRSGLTDFIEGDDTNNRSTGVGCAQTASVSDLNHTTISQNKKTYDIVNLSDSEMVSFFVVGFLENNLIARFLIFHTINHEIIYCIETI